MFSPRNFLRPFAAFFFLSFAAQLAATPVTWDGDATPANRRFASGTTFFVHASGGGVPPYTMTILKDGASFATGTFAAGANATEYGNKTVTFVATGTDGSPGSGTSTLTVEIYVPDTTLPSVPTNLQSTGIGASGFNLTWTASSDDQFVDYYEINLNGAPYSHLVNGVATTQFAASPWPASYNFPITGLTQGSTYAMTVRARDWAGNYSAWSSALNVFIPIIDVTPPTQPSSLGVSGINATGATVTLGTSTDAIGVTGYEVSLLLNGTVVAVQHTSGSTYTFSGLAAGTAYGLSVVAYDSMNNRSAPRTASFTTSAGSGPVPPTINPDVPLVTLPSTATRPTGSGNLVATVGASLSVDNKGSANYAIPLQIAPGRGGLQPQLSLSYSSGAGNGVAGLGWSLSTGFAQSITRGRSILARDGVVQGVTFTASDKFYLDGKRLVCVSGVYGQAGSVYRTEVDSFVTITAFGSGNYIDRFELVDKSGMKSTFGKLGAAIDAFQKGGGETGEIAYAYALKRVEDLLGNYVAFTYTNLGGGEYVLGQIDYTGGSGITPAAQVLLSYEARTDQPLTYLSSRFFYHRARLAAITAKSGTVTTAAYGLNYDTTTTFLVSGRSRLTSVSPFLADPQSQSLQACPVVTIGWQNHVSKLSNAYTIIPGINVSWADTNGDGIDEAIVDPLPLGSTTTTTKMGDFDGDGKKDRLTITVTSTVPIWNASVGIGVQSSAGVTIPINGSPTDFFQDPPDQNGIIRHYLLGSEGSGVASRVTVADFTGDGRDDILIHGFDGKVHLYVSQGTSFAEALSDAAHTPIVGGAGSQPWEFGTVISGHPTYAQAGIGPWSHYYVKPMPCDLNGDGRSDYVCVTYMRILKTTLGDFGGGVPTGIVTTRFMKGVLSKADGSFSEPFAIAQPPMGIPYQTVEPHNPTDPHDGSIRIDDVNSGPLPLDFNGDGLTDFLILVPIISEQQGLYTNTFGSHRWALYLNQGENSYGTITFAQYNGPIPNQVTLPGSETVNSYYTPAKSSLGIPGFLSNPVSFFTSTATEGLDFFTGFEGAAGSTNTYTWDVNHDGLADLVWFVATKPDETPSAYPGWYVMFSTGKIAADGSGFTTPVRIDSLNNVNGGDTVSGSAFASKLINHDIDYNGDGQPDYFIQSAANGRPASTGVVYLATAVDGVSSAPFGDLVSSITDGLGRRTDVAYKAAKDISLYTPGAAVTYPIRDMRASTPVVSDVWHDAGNSVATDRAQFSYQYSGNRLDLSGRGGLGFHSFVTLDRQTNLFKYQFLVQSFPMTGLTHREETYRYWTNGNSNFRFISSHDNTVVFDEVVKSPTDSTRWGTLYPFISHAVEYRWEDSTTPHFTFPGVATNNSAAEALFVQPKPSGAHIIISADSQFDNQTSTQTTLPANSPLKPSDLDAITGQNVVGSDNFNNMMARGLPRKITYGNLKKLSTDYGSGFTETVDTAYLAPVGPLTGLVDNVTTTVVSPVGGTEVAPVKRYTYEGNTPLVKTETIDATDNALDLKTTYTRDTRGRVTNTQIANTTATGAQAIGDYSASSASAFNDVFDLPTTISNAAPYSHQTVTQYHAFLGKPISVTDVNNAQVTTVYDALGRAIQQTDVLKNLTTNTTFAWDTSQTVTVPAGIVGLPGVTLTSAYSVTTTATVAPPVTAYYDRLGRVIRTIKEGFNDQLTVTDTVYNKLGQTVATSLPYLSGGTPLWTFTTYDPLGRVATVTAPNLTVTTNTYAGRTTTVTVTPVVGTAQTNATLVDAKGRTVSVWNTDNIGGTTPSIAFALDGFGRMRTTTLKGQAQTITAQYDALGRQTQLADPDKGTWNYLNNALGQVVTQTDAKTNVTQSTFDHLGRPLSRITTNTGYNETANFYYYDTDASKPNTVAKGTKGWIGAPEREECSALGSYPTTNLHYYDAKGRPSLELANTDGKWFYTYSDYDLYSRVRQVRHYWKPSGAELPNQQPYLWQDFGYTYTYDSKSYLTALTDSLGRSWWDTPTYDYMDRVTSVKKGNSLTTTRSYRATDGVLTAITTTGVQAMSFNFDGLGNLTSRADTGVSETYGYDNLNRLKTRNGGDIAVYQANGNINSKTEVGGATVTINGYDAPAVANPADTTAVRNLPHAVSSYTFNSQIINLKYDLNGNLLTRTGGGATWNMKWAGFDKPRWMAKTTGTTTVGSEFHYNAARSRVMQLEFDAMNGAGPTHYNRKRTYALGSTLELNYNNTAGTGAAPAWDLKKVRIYVPGPDGIIGAREFDVTSGTTGTEKALVYHYDHLGSITATTLHTTGALANDNDTSNPKPAKYSEDAWGQRRNPFTWSGAPLTAGTNKSDDGSFDSATPRGYTGHEMLDDLGLVHMNGRIYDPLLGRFLSADVVVQAPGSLQSYNRYSYVANNPLSLTDPSGFTIKQDVAAGLIEGPQYAFVDAGTSATVSQTTETASTASALASIYRFFGAETKAQQFEAMATDSRQMGQAVVEHGEKTKNSISDKASQQTGSTDKNATWRSFTRGVAENAVLLGVHGTAMYGAAKSGEGRLQDSKVKSVDGAKVKSTAPLQQQPQQQQGQQTQPGELQGPMIIPANATIVRGGSTAPGGAASPEGITNGSGVVTGVDGKVSGVSVAAGVKSVAALAVPPIQNRQVSVTTAAAIRDAGGAITPAPSVNNPDHALVSEITAKKLSELLKQEPNPNK